MFKLGETVTITKVLGFSHLVDDTGTVVGITKILNTTWIDVKVPSYNNAIYRFRTEELRDMG